MFGILKEEWKARRIPILQMSGLLLILNVGAFIFLGIGLQQAHMGFIPVLWTIIGCASTIFIGTLYPLIFGAANISRVLFRDTGYLLLTIPRRGYSIIGGKLIIGLAEFIILGFQSFIYGIIFICFMFYHSGSSLVVNQSFWEIGSYVFRIIFVDNFRFVLVSILLAVAGFIMAALLINAAAILIRSFWKNRKFAGILTFIALILMINIPITVAENIYGALPPVREWQADLSSNIERIIPDSISFTDKKNRQMKKTSFGFIRNSVDVASSKPFVTVFNVPVFHSEIDKMDTVPLVINWFILIICMLFALGYFAAASYLLEKRVEI